jgi:hypothetical protein
MGHATFIDTSELVQTQAELRARFKRVSASDN